MLLDLAPTLHHCLWTLADSGESVFGDNNGFCFPRGGGLVCRGANTAIARYQVATKFDPLPKAIIDGLFGTLDERFAMDFFCLQVLVALLGPIFDHRFQDVHVFIEILLSEVCSLLCPRA